jgi:amidase
VTPSRRDLLRLAGAVALLTDTAAADDGFPLAGLAIADLQGRMASGALTSRAIVELYLARIEAIDRSGPTLHAVLEIDPDSLAAADALDLERLQHGPRGPLHGIPILVKDNIEVAGKMATTAGSYALVGAPAPDDALCIRRLRAAGAVVLGKTNLSEWANFRDDHSTSGWTGRGGLTRNPYVLDRSASGSSSGSAAAVAADLCAAAVGSETDGSLVSPASVCGIVAIKPAVGRVSQDGIIPISHSQDTAGPMARTVADAALLLAALAGPDPGSGVPTLEEALLGPFPRDALRGARLGVPRNLTEFDDHVGPVFEAALQHLRDAGAVLVDPADLPTIERLDGAELTVLLAEFHQDLAAYFAARGGPVQSVADVAAYDTAHPEQELAWFGQALLEKSTPAPREAEYHRALARCRRLARQRGIDHVTRRFALRAFVAPTNGPAWSIDLVNGDAYSGGTSTAAAVAGYPAITVPMGDVHGLPVGITFFGRPDAELALIGFAAAFESRAQARRPPAFLPSLLP